MSNSINHTLPYPIYNAKYTLLIPYLDADGDPTDPTTPDTEISQDGGTFADCTEEVTTITGSNGTGYITLTGAEMKCVAAAVCGKVASGPKATLAFLQPRVLPVISNGTAQAGGNTSITLQSTAPAYDITGCFVRTTGGTGGGGTNGVNNQARMITAYNVSTKEATVFPAWETNPANDTTYDILLSDVAVNSTVTRALKPATDGRSLAVDSNGRTDISLIEGSGATDQINAACDTAISDAGVTTARMGALTDWIDGGRLDLLLDALLTRLTAARAGYLDNLSAGAVALASGVTVTTNNDKTGYTASTVSDKTGYSLSVTPPTAADIATAVWAAGTRTLSSFGSLVADIATAVWGAVARTITGGTVDTCTTNTDMRGTDSALLAANYTAPNNSGITGIKAKTDQLTFTEANKVDATATVSVAGLATEAKQDEIISAVAGVITHGDSNWLTPSGIGGTIAVTFNVKDDSGNNILDAVVEVWDTAGTTLKERKETNSSGNAVFNCKAEAYTIKITKSGYSFDNASYTVTVPATVNYVMTAFNIPVSPDLTKCRVWMKLVNTYSSLTVTADVPENLTGNNLVMGNYTGVYDTVNNLVYWDLPIGALNSVLKITELGFEVVVPLILDLESSELKDLI